MEMTALLAARYHVDLGHLSPSPIEIPGATRRDLPGLFAEAGYGRGAEIGVCLGTYAEALCQANPDLHLLCVDPWAPYGIYQGRRWQRELAEVHAVAVARLVPYPCTIVRRPSVEAALAVPLASLDFVYIDADHAYEHVLEDLTLWATRVCPGGVVSGHDYHDFGARQDVNVMRAVDEYTAAHHIHPWFLLGTAREARRQPDRQDRCRSFLWVQ